MALMNFFSRGFLTVKKIHADFSNSNYLRRLSPAESGLGTTVNTVKADVNYHFGAPVVARC
jgi:hypothetical protein